MQAILDDILTGSHRLRDPQFWALVGSAALLVIVMAWRWDDFRRFFGEDADKDPDS
jgi:hypothetical protein